MPKKNKLDTPDMFVDLGVEKQDDFSLSSEELNSDVISYVQEVDMEEVMEGTMEEIKRYKLKILYVENNALVVNLFGWSKRVYFDLPFSQLDYIRCNKNRYKGKLVDIAYMGDISKPFEVKILPLKSIDSICK